MTDTITESFCERCGTRFSFEKASKPRRGGIGRVRVLTRGIKNYVANDGMPMAEAMAVARDDEQRAGVTRQLDAFHKTFNFCMSCRQYTCATCWNEKAGECLTCAPDLAREVPAEPMAELPAALPSAGNGHETVDSMSWPRVDLDRDEQLEEFESSGVIPETEPVVEEPDVLARLNAFVGAPAHPPVEELTADELAEIQLALAATHPAVERGTPPADVVATASDIGAAEAITAEEPVPAAEDLVAEPAVELSAEEPVAAAEELVAEPAVGVSAEELVAEPAVEPGVAVVEVTAKELALPAAEPVLAGVDVAAEEPVAAAEELVAEPAVELSAEEPVVEPAVAPVVAVEEPIAAVEEPEAELVAEPVAEPGFAVVEPVAATGAEPVSAEPAVVVAAAAAAAVVAELVTEPAETSPADEMDVARGRTRSLLGRFRPARPGAAAPEPIAAAAAVPEPAQAAPSAPEPVAPAALAAPAAAAPEQAPAPAAPTPAPAAPTDVIEQPTWRIIAPDAGSEPERWPEAPAWPTPPAPTSTQVPGQTPGAAASPWASRLATARPEPPTSVWAASSQEVLGGPISPLAAKGAPAVQACVSCGLSLSANARFCRRCGTRQS